MKCIYLRTNTANGKQYVGQANDFDKREREWKCLSGRYAGKLITNARNKYGVENFKTEVLKECQTQDELNFWEQYYIKELNTKTPNGYNLTDGGDTSSGYKFTEETKKILSEIKKGCIPWIKGKCHTEEAKKKMSEMKKGKPSPNKGKHLSAEAKKILSESRKGKPNINLSKKVYQYTLEGELVKVWDSTSECRKNGFYNISVCCNGKRKDNNAYGFKWSYTKKEGIN
jgi:group I intron endonuclease